MEGKPKHPGGRPTMYNQELADRICELISTSTHGTKKLCKMHDWMPSDETIYKWRYRHPEFAGKYAEAKARQADLLIEEIVKIADHEKNDRIIDSEGKIVINSVKVARDRLRIDTRKWIACKLLPKVYGERQAPKAEETETLIDKVIDKL